MTDNGLPCLDLLEATPGILRGLMSELTEDDARHVLEFMRNNDGEK